MEKRGESERVRECEGERGREGEGMRGGAGGGEGGGEGEGGKGARGLREGWCTTPAATSQSDQGQRCKVVVL